MLKLSKVLFPLKFNIHHRIKRIDLSTISKATVKFEDEIERKFKVSEETIKLVTHMSKTNNEVKFTDDYFDLDSYELTRRDMWLRKRDNVLELKYPMKNLYPSDVDSLVGIDYYHETRDIKNIVKMLEEHFKLKFSTHISKNITPWLVENQLIQFASIQTIRNRTVVEVPTNSSENIIINVDIDRVIYNNIDGELTFKHENGNRVYEIGEIELVKKPSNLKSSEALKVVFEILKINPTPTKGKVLEYLYRYKPKHYLALHKAGLLNAKLGETANKLSEIEIKKILSVLENTAINYHFSRKCNYSCNFCFHTAKSSDILCFSDILIIYHELIKYKVKKINFAGGEPFLKSNHKLLGEMVKSAKEIGFESVSIISNNSNITEEWFISYGKYLDILGISCDSMIIETNLRHGRFQGGIDYLKLQKKYNSNNDNNNSNYITNNKNTDFYVINKLFQTKALCDKYNIKFKINTVVTKFNYQEDMSTVINELKPMRWKIFQVLGLNNENMNDKKQRNVFEYLITDDMFNTFTKNNKNNLKIDSKIMKIEDNNTMNNSYILIDEYGRFLDCSTGSKLPTKSILEVGLLNAFNESVNGFNKEKFYERDGYYPEEWTKK